MIILTSFEPLLVNHSIDTMKSSIHRSDWKLSRSTLVVRWSSFAFSCFQVLDTNYSRPLFCVACEHLFRHISGTMRHKSVFLCCRSILKGFCNCGRTFHVTFLASADGRRKHEYRGDLRSQLWLKMQSDIFLMLDRLHFLIQIYDLYLGMKTLQSCLSTTPVAPTFHHHSDIFRIQWRLCWYFASNASWSRIYRIWSKRPSSCYAPNTRASSHSLLSEPLRCLFWSLIGGNRNPSHDKALKTAPDFSLAWEDKDASSTKGGTWTLHIVALRRNKEQGGGCGHLRDSPLHISAVKVYDGVVYADKLGVMAMLAAPCPLSRVSTSLNMERSFRSM